MAPSLDKEADHIRNKAKKELLGLLEGVSIGAHVAAYPVHFGLLSLANGRDRSEARRTW